MRTLRDHGGGLDAAIAQWGGKRAEWLDLSTGINPVAYPLPRMPDDIWTALPDRGAFDLLIARARAYWNVPEDAAILPAAGASALIAALPRLRPPGIVNIPAPTYNEHAAAFAAAGWSLSEEGATAVVVVHPNNPDGQLWQADSLAAPLTVIDESFCDVMPEASLVHLSGRKGTVVLKSFGKFWGLAGLRLGFAIGDPDLLADLGEVLGPWQVSGPGLFIGAEALADPFWADETRARLTSDAKRMDDKMTGMGAVTLGGTPLFRLYQVQDAKAAQDHLASRKIWSRIFPYSDDWLRLGMPPPDRWDQLDSAF